MATLVSKAAYAKLHGRSPQAAKKWEAKGCLVLVDGKVHVERSDEHMLHAGLGRFAQGAPGPQPAVNPQPAPPPVDAALLDDPQVNRTLTAFVEQLLTGDYASLVEAATVKENALALKRVLEARREAGRLIDLESAEKLFFEAGRTARDAWLNFPTRVGPLMAAELDVSSDRLVEVLAAHVHEQLTDLGEPEFAADGAGAPAAGLS